MNLFERFSVSVLCCFLLCCCEYAGAEWIDVPQFSNQHKVYRQPVRLVFPKSTTQRPLKSYSDSGSELYHYPAIGDSSFGHHENLYKVFNSQNINQHHVKRRPEIFLDDSIAFSAGTIATFTTERIISSIIDEYDRSKDFHKLESFDDYDDVHRFDVQPVLHTYSTKKFRIPTSTTLATITTKTSQTPITTARSVTNANTTTSTVKSIIRLRTTKSRGTSPKPEDNQSSHEGIFDYLPIDLLKKVHRTLKYQPSTIKGKIKFLKAFEQALIGEIRTRLNAALSIGPSRKPRDARSDWGHDESIGFPSLEGTLMAISFLTFAVYLVRLVMLLFRNVSGTGTAPIFIGRKKRFTDLRNEDTERILNYLSHPFDPDYS